MKGMRFGAVIAATVLAVLLLLPVAAYAANIAQNGLVKFYTEKPSYLPNSDITIVAEFSSPFTGTYMLQLYGPTGELIDAKTGNVENTTKITYVFHHNEELYGYGVFKAVLTYSGYVIVGGQKQNVYSATPLEITFTVAPSYSIEGKVVDEAGNPVAGATVYVVEAGTKVVTGDDGSFVVAVKSPGTYTILVSKTDYLSNSTVVKVESIGTTKLEKPIVIVSQAYMIKQLLAMEKELAKKLDEVSGKLDDIATKYESLSNSLNDLASKVNANSEAIKGNADKIKSLEDSIADVRKSIDELKASIDQLRSLLDQYATKNYVDTKIAAAIQNAVNSLTAKIDDLSKRLDQLESKLAQYATKDYVDSKAGDLESKLTGEIQKLKSDIDSIKSDVSNLKSTVIQQLSQNLEKATNNANRASNIALVAVILAIIGIIIAIVVAVRLMKLTAA